MEEERFSEASLEPTQHLWWRFFKKTVNSKTLVLIIAKKLSRRQIKARRRYVFGCSHWECYEMTDLL